MAGDDERIARLEEKVRELDRANRELVLALMATSAGALAVLRAVESPSAAPSLADRLLGATTTDAARAALTAGFDRAYAMVDSENGGEARP